ncbi:MAG: LysM peptidoglycan-binding domain-containing protein [Nitrospira sp.]|nr:LysM peptidoglycan-binding domain-containing protein [Nitrospira sp.]
MPIRLSFPDMTVAVLVASLTACLFLFPDKSLGGPVSMASSTPAPVQDDDDEDLDANLVPLEPELTIIPPDLSSTDAAPDKNAGPVAGQPPAGNTQDSTTHTTQQILATGPNDISYNIPVILDPAVQSHIRFFNTSIRSRFEQWLIRFSRYRPMVEKIFAEFNLPSDLVNLSLVESGFNPYAYSRAKATGPWQFMQGTGKVYGLRIDHYVDERRDPIKSTVAAARYLRDLYDIFGAWPLAMAAYNAGEGKVLRALHKVQGETFSDIAKTKLIRQETKQYVPRIMAATIIARSPQQYGFDHAPAAPHQFEEVLVNRALHMRSIASASGIAYEDLRLLNPELRRDATPPDASAYHLKVPVGTADKVAGLLDRIPTYKFPPIVSTVRHVKARSPQSYRVRAGDTLEKVSKRFRVPLRTLKTRNNLSSSVIRPGEFLTISR